jgi:hypothetical protein
MTEQQRREDLAAAWIERARYRLAECEAEVRKRPTGGGKLTVRVDRYRDLVSDLRDLLPPGDPPPPPEIDAIEQDLKALKEKLFDLARELVQAKEEWKALKLRWGAEADRAMRERESRGEPAGRAPALDFRLSPPSPEASPAERAAHEILKALLP